MAAGERGLAGLRVTAFESRRVEEIARLLEQARSHG